LLQLIPATVLTAGVVAVALGACGADPDDSAHPGRSLATDYGCIACHSTNGDPGVGVTWKGLYGSQMALEDGTTITVDRDFLVKSIKDPAADVLKGTKVPMPVNNVPDADVQAIVDYIISLK
jgi:cytochrome c oxidase subunit 2